MRIILLNIVQNIAHMRARIVKHMSDAEEIRLKAERGDPQAEFHLGWKYQKGKGMSKDFGKALTWYRKAAEQGHVRAMNNLGGLYARGEGILQDYRQAIYWYKQAAEAGDAIAQWNLGPLYYSGLGVAPDRTASYMWITIAVETGLRSWRHRLARFSIGIFLTRKQRIEARKLAEEWLEKARRSGSPI
jgi:TPR repeat protein